MPFTHDIRQADRLVVIVGSGNISLGDVRDLRLAMAADPAIVPGLPSLVDLRAVTGFALTGREVLKLARSHIDAPFLSPDSRTAVVVPDAVGFALARMYALSRHKNAEPMAIFYDYDEALRWLAIRLRR